MIYNKLKSKPSGKAARNKVFATYMSFLFTCISHDI